MSEQHHVSDVALRGDLTAESVPREMVWLTVRLEEGGAGAARVLARRVAAKLKGGADLVVSEAVEVPLPEAARAALADMIEATRAELLTKLMVACAEHVIVMAKARKLA